MFDIEIRKVEQFNDAKEILDEIATRTCVCKRVLLSTTGLKNHKRACNVAKAQPITMESSTASSTSENSMMIQLMNEMREERREERKAQKEQTNLLTKLLEERTKQPLKC